MLIEKYIQRKKELECAIIEKKKKTIVSNVGEILNSGNMYDYNSKYINKIDTCISSIDKDVSDKIKYFSKKIFYILKCKDLSRIDFLYDLDEKKIYFNEINTIPGMTDISMYPKLINDIGITSKELITTLLSI